MGEMKEEEAAKRARLLRAAHIKKAKQVQDDIEKHAQEVAKDFGNKHFKKSKSMDLLERPLNAMKEIDALHAAQEHELAKIKAQQKHASSKACKIAHQTAFKRCSQIVHLTNTKCADVLKRSDAMFVHALKSGSQPEHSAEPVSSGDHHPHLADDVPHALTNKEKVDVAAAKPLASTKTNKAKVKEEQEVLSSNAVGHKDESGKVVADRLQEQATKQKIVHHLSDATKLQADSKFSRATKQAKDAVSTAAEEITAQKKTAKDAVDDSKTTYEQMSELYQTVLHESQKSLYEQQEQLFEELVEPL